jgi:hypothetical protein
VLREADATTGLLSAIQNLYLVLIILECPNAIWYVFNNDATNIVINKWKLSVVVDIAINLYVFNTKNA